MNKASLMVECGLEFEVTVTLSPAQVRLAQSAAFVAGCEAVTFLPGPGLDAGPIACVGPQVTISASALAALRDVLAELQPGDVPFEPYADDKALLRQFELDGGQFARSLIVVPAWDSNETYHGALLLIDPHQAIETSPAKTYVLATHGLQFGEACHRRDRPSRPDLDDSRAQRLRLLESVVVHANDAILITEAEPIDLPGPRIVYCNAAFTRTTGYSEAEVLGKTPRLLQSPQIDRTSLDRLRRALERWKPVEVQLLNVKKDGTEFWVELSIVPVADERGWFTHWVSVQRDISQRRMADELAVRARVAEVENKALAAEIQERRNVEEQLLYAAYHDDLTRLRNRAYLMDRLTGLLGAGEVSGPYVQCSLLFLDLDRFKLVNDSLGHRAGDLLLIEVSRRLRACTRPQDTLARVGGDEFAILIEVDESEAAASRVAERVLAALSRPIVLEGSEVFTSCSIGIVHALGGYEKPEELLRDADIAMYRAKKNGSNGFATYSTEMHAEASASLTLQTALRHALVRSEFNLHYQPIYDVMTGRMTDLEALVRWMHPVRGLVPPAAFIPMAEEIGLIRELDRWVLRQACLQMRQWQTLFPGLDARVSVNVSGDELRDPGFLADLQEILQSTGLEGRCVQLEITEGVFLREPELIGQILSEVRLMGVRIALDDFGTGYSSLGYLDRYPIDTLKVDRSFVARMLRQERAMAIMDGIVRLGTALDLTIVAEGVEKEAQLIALRTMGCHRVQGYLLGRPSPVAYMTGVLRAQTGRHHARGRRV